MFIPFGCCVFSHFIHEYKNRYPHIETHSTSDKNNNEINDTRSFDCNKWLWENVIVAAAAVATRFIFGGCKMNTEGKKTGIN